MDTGGSVVCCLLLMSFVALCLFFQTDIINRGIIVTSYKF